MMRAPVVYPTYVNPPNLSGRILLLQPMGRFLRLGMVTISREHVRLVETP